MSRLGVRREGPSGAPVVVLSNSLGTTSAMWDPQMAALAQRFEVVRYEQRGHGGTAVEPGACTIGDLGGDLLEVLDLVGAQRASVVGVSLGGMVGMWVAANHPDRVERLVVACSAASLPPAQSWQQRAALVRGSGPGALLEACLGRWFTASYLERNPEVVGLVADMLGQASAEGYATCAEAIGSADLWADLAGIRAPTLVLAGASDPVVSPAMALRVQQAITGSSLRVLADAAHLLNVEQAPAFTAAVIEHLSGTASERGRSARADVLGEEHVARSEGGGGGFGAPFVDFMTKYAWGEVWTRPGLDRRTRSALTLALLTALGRTDELALHVRGALRNGMSEAEIAEVLIHTAVYAGVPASNSAFAVARRVLEHGGG